MADGKKKPATAGQGLRAGRKAGYPICSEQRRSKKRNTCQVFSNAVGIRERVERDPWHAYAALGLHLSRDGTHRWRSLCPLHNDKDPSLKIFADGRWYCFGCQRGGDFLDLYQALHNVDFAKAVQDAASLLGIAGTLPGNLRARPRPLRAVPKHRATVARHQCEATQETAPTGIETTLVEALHQKLLATPGVLEWLERNRGLPRWIIEEAKLGYGRVGCWREPRIAIPVPALDDSTWVDIRGYLPDGRPKMLPYARGTGKPALYGWTLVGGHNELLWVEGEIDCLNAIARGIPAVTATCGVPGALSCPLPDLSGKVIILCPDDDEAGDKLRRELPARLYEAGAKEVIVSNPSEALAHAHP